MGSTSPKRTVRRTRRSVAANSPAPEGVSMGASNCGHSGCGVACNVRYCGPTTNLRDHYAVHASRGVAHVWPAAIVAGLAVVLTGSFAFAALPPKISATELGSIVAQLQALNNKVDRLDVLVTAAEAAAAQRSVPVQVDETSSTSGASPASPPRGMAGSIKDTSSQR